jgi:hypothetical protein
MLHLIFLESEKYACNPILFEGESQHGMRPLYSCILTTGIILCIKITHWN